MDRRIEDMMDDDRIREIAAEMARNYGEYFDALRPDGQLKWYWKAAVAVVAIESAGYEIKPKDPA